MTAKLSTSPKATPPALSLIGDPAVAGRVRACQPAWESRNERALPASLVSSTIAPWALPAPNANACAEVEPPSRPCSSSDASAAGRSRSEVRKIPACGPSQGATSRL